MSLVNKTLEGTRFLLTQQLLTRLATFSINVFLIRHSPAMGVVMDLDLYWSSILFLSREPFRMALLRNTNRGMSLAYVPLLFGLLGSVVLLCLTTMEGSEYQALLLYLTSALIELSCEPVYIHLQSALQYGVRVGIEGAAFTAQIVTVFVLYVLHLQQSEVQKADGVMYYAYGQLVFGIVLFLGYLYHAPPFKTIRPQRVNGVYFDPYLVSISLSFIGQSILKHVLTVGDKILMVSQGISSEQKWHYTRVSDLGSLVARMLFQPLEEASRTLFAKSATTNTKTQIQDAFDWFTKTIKFHILFGSLFVFFGSNYTQLLLEVLYKMGNTQAPRILSVYCLYVPVMGLNGISEAFLQAVGDARILGQQTVFLIGLWFVYILLSHLFLNVLGMGAIGLVVCNIINLSLRTGFSMYFAKAWFQERNRNLLKHISVGNGWLWSVFVLSGLVCHWTDYGIDSLKMVLVHVGVGGMCLLLTGYTM
ncbi:Rft protein-domain-containing protein [Gorgonomyces haynaldii]|nr:Rft protein-domain-containing protein [Gorgonomyces haynaldii]